MRTHCNEGLSVDHDRVRGRISGNSDGFTLIQRGGSAKENYIAIRIHMYSVCN